ncbi:MAG: hypothetical protein HOY71_39705, partial [Nonomuraea sp.]|nr:hypothetical protein [Nonomuraea sp.]
MLSISRQLLAVAVSAFALTAVPVAAAADDGPGPVDGVMTVDRIGPPRPPGPKGRYTITVNRTARVTLTCAPDGGTHQDPRAACRLLRALKGDPRGLTNGSE